MGTRMGNQTFRDSVKPKLDAGELTFVKVLQENDYSMHDGTDYSNEIGLWRQPGTPQQIMQKVMLTAAKYHQRRKALAEMVHAWLDEGLGGNRIVPPTYAEEFNLTDSYKTIWAEKPKEPDRIRVCQVVHQYVEAVPGDKWRGIEYARVKDLLQADRFCRMVIEAHPDAERMALLDFLTINQDRSARNWVTSCGTRFYAIDNGMAWFHEFPDNDDWKMGCVIDDVILQKEPWQFISGVFTTSYAGWKLSGELLPLAQDFDWNLFCKNLDLSCRWLGLPALSEDWRFLGLRRRLEWIQGKGRFPTISEYRSWFNNGSELFTPPQIVASGGKIVWTKIEDRP